ncbi:MAG: hypothetical protein J0H88_22210 [Sphingomonadales bacterium]|nr:hypothetical protein [Sphingomonadales bacterium]
MTFAGLRSTDFEKIARAEAIGRARAAMANATITADQRQLDERQWAAIAKRAAWFNEDRTEALFEGETVDRARAMAAAVMRATQAALRKWREDGKPAGEPEARAFLLFALTRKFAELAADPTPYVDADGNIYFRETERNAA